MSYEETLKELKNLISDFEDKKEELDDMQESWEKYDDPSCDPGLQFSLGEEINTLWEELCDFCNTNMKK